MWVLYALTTAVLISANTIFIKRLMRSLHWSVVALAQWLAAAPFLLLVVLAQPPQTIGRAFWVGVLGSGLLNIIGTMAAYKATSMADVSFLAPLAAFNPILTAIIALFTLGEVPTARAVIGMVSIGVGAVLLGKEPGISHQRSLANLFQRRPVQYTLLSFLIWSITPTFEKPALLAIQPSNPALLSLAAGLLIALGLLPVAFRQAPRDLARAVSQASVFLVVGALTTVAMIAAFTAYTMAQVSYAVAVFRSSMFFTIIFAAVFLHEGTIKSRLGAALFMFAGIILLVL